MRDAGAVRNGLPTHWVLAVYGEGKGLLRAELALDLMPCGLARLAKVMRDLVVPANAFEGGRRRFS